MKKILSALLMLVLLLYGCGKEAPVEPQLTKVGFTQLGAESD